MGAVAAVSVFLKIPKGDWSFQFRSSQVSVDNSVASCVCVLLLPVFQFLKEYLEIYLLLFGKSHHTGTSIKLSRKKDTIFIIYNTFLKSQKQKNNIQNLWYLLGDLSVEVEIVFCFEVWLRANPIPHTIPPLTQPLLLGNAIHEISWLLINLTSSPNRKLKCCWEDLVCWHRQAKDSFVTHHDSLLYNSLFASSRRLRSLESITKIIASVPE